MDWSGAHTIATYVLVAVLALASWRDRTYAPLLAFFVWMVAVDLVRDPLDAVYRDADTLKRLWLHLDQALFLSLDFTFVWACGRVFGFRRVEWVALAGWALALGTLVIGRSLLPEGSSAYIYTTSSIFALVCTWYFVLRAVFGRTRPELVHLAGMVIIAGDTVSTLYGFIDWTAGGLSAFAASWDAVLAVDVLCLGLAAIVSGIRVVKRAPA